MANPTPEAIAAIQAKVSDWNTTDAAIVTALNTEQIANPNTGLVLPPLSMMAMAQRISPETALRIINWPNLPLLKTEVDKGERAATMNWLGLLSYCGMVSQAEFSAVNAYFMTPITDPARPAQLPWSVVTLGRLVDAEDIAAARPEA